LNFTGRQDVEQKNVKLVSILFKIILPCACI
jgi:hypothetical protein